MKIASLTPQFIVETPSSTQVTERERIRSDLHGRPLSELEENDETEPDSRDNHQETREGLKRLAKLLRDKKRREGGHLELVRPLGSFTSNTIKHRAIALYQQIASASGGINRKGSLFDEEF